MNSCLLKLAPRACIALSLLAPGAVRAQINSFPYCESFDSVAAPNLPPGWSTSTNRSALGDFVTTSSSVRSNPNAALSTDATISQTLTSPRFDFTNRVVDRLEFYERRSSSHNSAVVIEASIDGGSRFFAISDRLLNPGSSSYTVRGIGLPDALDDRTNIKFRWRIIGDGTGKTGTYRIDDISLTVRPNVDISVETLHVPTGALFVGDQVSVSVTVRNLAARPASNFGVVFFLAPEGAETPFEGDRYDSVTVATVLSPGDSVLVTARSVDVQVGRPKIFVRVTIEGDEDLSNNAGSITMSVGYMPFTVTVNEILYAPSSPEPEWIELHNTSADSINLKDWRVTDKSGTKALLTSREYYLPGNGYVVLTDDSSLYAVHPSVARSTLIMNLPSLNNTGDAVVVFDHRNVTIDSLIYSSSWGGSGGRSLERISPGSLSTDPTNWGTSRDPKRSTPGKKNSLTPKDYDLGISRFVFDPALPLVSEELTLAVDVTNFGRASAAGFEVRIFRDADEDSVGQPSEVLLHAENPALILSGESAVYSVGLMQLQAGEHLFIAEVLFPADEDTTNNRLIASVIPGYSASSIIINEIMYGPKFPEPEWVEFYNATGDSIDLRGWRISNRASGTRHLIASTTYRVAPRQYFLVTRDSIALVSVHPAFSAPVLTVVGLPTFFLSNNGDAVVLSDPSGSTIDSVSYDPSWGGGIGSSLERVSLLEDSNNPSNWGTSRSHDGSTPGVRNTLSPKDYDLAISQVSFDPPRPSVGENVTVRAAVVNRGLRFADRYSVEFFEDVDRDSIPHEGERFFLQEEFLPLQPGDSLLFVSQILNVTRGYHRIIIRIQFSDDEDSTNNMKGVGFKTRLGRRVIVSNEIMYAPSAGQPEWVELYNRLEYAVDLNGWTLTNRAGARRYKIEVNGRPIGPQSHVVITKDSSAFFASHARVTGTVLQLGQLPSFFLNNSGDTVVLADDLGITMDSVSFTASWGGQGKSLERIDPLSSSTDSLNWGTSIDSLGSTPTRRNSLLPLDVDLAIRRVIPDPSSPSVDGIVSFAVTVQNVGFRSIGGFDVQLAVDENRDGLPQEFEVRRSVRVEQTLDMRDSLVALLEYGPLKAEENSMILVLNAPGDQNLRNNLMLQTLRLRHRDRSVVINEIMYDPLPGGAEYVELFNRSPSALSLEGWTLSDRPNLQGNRNVVSVTSDDVVLPSGGYAVLASDSSLTLSFPELRERSGLELVLFSGSGFSLSNNGDDIVLKDAAGHTVDSVSYTPRWHNPEVIDASGRALERIHPEGGSNDSRNWSTCADRRGGTPGRQNSIFASFVPFDTRLSFNPNPFSPDGDGFEDFTVMHYNLPLPTATVRVKIFDSLGRLVRVLSHGEPSGSQGDLIWDGLDDDRKRLRIGIYIVVLEALDSVGGELETAKAVVVLAGWL